MMSSYHILFNHPGTSEVTKILFWTLNHTALCTNLSYDRSSLYRLSADNKENASHVIPIQRVYWSAVA
jgi:hypothetical protein